MLVSPVFREFDRFLDSWLNGKDFALLSDVESVEWAFTEENGDLDILAVDCDFLRRACSALVPRYHVSNLVRRKTGERSSGN